MKFSAMFNAISAAFSAIAPSRNNTNKTSIRKLTRADIDVPTPYTTLGTERSEVGTIRCTIRGYPSGGGFWEKKADVLNMSYLGVPRSHAVQRSNNASEEDAFCDHLQRIGTTWWASPQEYHDVVARLRVPTEAETKVVVFGWPAAGPGVWVLRYADEKHVPRDFGRVRMTLTMEERIEAMRSSGADSFEDLTQVEELSDDYPHKVASYYCVSLRECP